MVKMTKKDVTQDLQGNPSQDPRFEILKNQIRARLQETGELEKLKKHLSDKLSKSGWKSAMRDELKAVVKENPGQNVTVEDLYASVRTYGRETIDPKVKNEMMKKIRKSTIKAFVQPNNTDTEEDIATNGYHHNNNHRNNNHHNRRYTNGRRH